MAHRKNLDDLRQLDLTVLDEVVREGEVMLQAQFTAATASDQRAIAWTGFIITLVIALMGATASIAISGQNFGIAILAGVLSILLSIAAFTATQIFRPAPFALPGNLPENWLPSEWETGKTRDLTQARIEQARCLNNQINDNKILARKSVYKLISSIKIATISIILFAVSICCLLGFRHLQKLQEQIFTGIFTTRLIE